MKINYYWIQHHRIHTIYNMLVFWNATIFIKSRLSKNKLFSMEYHLLSVKLETNKKTPGGGLNFYWFTFFWEEGSIHLSRWWQCGTELLRFYWDVPSTPVPLTCGPWGQYSRRWWTVDPCSRETVRLISYSGSRQLFFYESVFFYNFAKPLKIIQ